MKRLSYFLIVDLAMEGTWSVAPTIRVIYFAFSKNNYGGKILILAHWNSYFIVMSLREPVGLDSI